MVVGLDGSRTEVDWDHERFPYLANGDLDGRRARHCIVQSRDQQSSMVLRVDVGDGPPGATTEVFARPRRVWVELVPGTPSWLPTAGS